MTRLVDDLLIRCYSVSVRTRGAQRLLLFLGVVPVFWNLYIFFFGRRKTIYNFIAISSRTFRQIQFNSIARGSGTGARGKSNKNSNSKQINIALIPNWNSDAVPTVIAWGTAATS